MKNWLIILTFFCRSYSVIVSIFPSSPRLFHDLAKSTRKVENVTGEVTVHKDDDLDAVAALSDIEESGNEQGLSDASGRPDLEKFSCSFPSQESEGGLRVSTCDFGFSTPSHLPEIEPWLLGVGKNAYWLGGPTEDGSGSTSGGYAFVDVSRSLNLGGRGEKKAWLSTTFYPPTGPEGRCFKFSVTSTGTAVRALRVYMVQLYPLDPQMRRIYRSAYHLPSIRREEDLIKALPVWNIFNHTGNWRETVFPLEILDTMVEMAWTQQNLTYSSPYPHGFLFEAEVDQKPGARGYVALDGISFTSGSCKAECEFNSNFCDWTHGEGDFKWSIGRGSTKAQTGPLFDQGTASGNPTGGGFAYIDSATPRRSGQVAKLVSAELKELYGTGPICLSFWLNMHGEGVGQLRIIKEETTKKKLFRQHSEDDEENVLWRLNENGPRNLWYRGQVTLSPGDEFKVVFEATIGESEASDIAIDTVKIRQGACPILPQNAATSQSGSFDCTFLDNTCSWQLRAAQVSRLYGNFQPSFDMTDPLWTKAGINPFDGSVPGRAAAITGTPNPYMLFRTSPALSNAPAFRGFLVSPQIQNANETMCLSFWALLMSLENRKFGGLEVLLCESVPSRLDLCKSLWRLNNHQHTYWFHSQVTFTATTNESVLVISGIQGNGVRGNIGVDDVAIFKGRCETEPKSANNSIGDCYFDNGFCGWTIDNSEISSSPQQSSSATSEAPTTSSLSPTPAIPSTSTTTTFTSVKPGVVSFTVNVSSPTVIPNINEATDKTSSSNIATEMSTVANSNTITTLSAERSTSSPTSSEDTDFSSTASSAMASQLSSSTLISSPTTITSESSTSSVTSTVSNTTIRPPSTSNSMTSSSTKAGDEIISSTPLDSLSSSTRVLQEITTTVSSLATTQAIQTSNKDTDNVSGIEEEAVFADVRSSNRRRAKKEKRHGRILNKLLLNHPPAKAEARQTQPDQTRDPTLKWAVNYNPFGYADKFALPVHGQGKGSFSTLFVEPHLKAAAVQPTDNNRPRWKVSNNPFGDSATSAISTQDKGSSSTVVFQGTPGEITRWGRPLENPQEPPQKPVNPQIPAPGLLHIGYSPSLSYFSFHPVQNPSDNAKNSCNETERRSVSPLKLIPTVKKAEEVSSFSKEFAGGFQWRRNDWRLADPNEINLGLRDRTFGILNGGFAYFWGSNSTRLAAPKAALGSFNICIQFYFSPVGVGKKRLEIKRLTEGEKVEVLWRVKSEDMVINSHNRGSPWSLGQVWVKSGSKAVFFEGTAEAGGFALDDLSIRESTEPECIVMPAQAAT